MRVIAVADYGAPPAETDLPTPEPAPGEVLVRVQASSINGFDTSVAAGMLKGMMEHRFPVVLGKDFAGTVTARGQGAGRFAVGDPVFGVVMKPVLGDGTFGEYVTVSDQYGIATRPAGLPVPAAGALGLAGAAAVTAVEAASPQPGQTVLICGATGGVGALAVQYAAATGAQVIATARRGTEAEFVRDLGAAHAVDYTGDLASHIRAIAPKGVDAVIHLAGDGAPLAGLLAEDGRLVSTLGYGPDQHPAATAIMADPNPGTLARLAADAAGGRIRVPVTASFALADVPAALATFAGGTLGKLAVSIG